MKLNHILYEARAAKKQQAPAKLVTKPRLQREGDFAWHLYKFFEPTNVDTATKKNPAFKKEVTKVVAEVIKEFKKKFPKNQELQMIQTARAAPMIASASWYSAPSDFEPWPYDPDEGYDDIGEWEREQEQERQWHAEQNNGWSVNTHRGMGDNFQRHQGHGGHKPTTEKLLDAISKETKRRLDTFHDRLPNKDLPTASTVAYEPRDGIRVFVDGNHIVWIRARLDAKGNVTSAKFQGDTKQHNIKGLINKSPSELRELIKYYKTHDDY